MYASHPIRLFPALLVALLLSAAPALATSSPAPDAPQRWSDPWTWGGQLPAAGDEVVVPMGKHVVLDVHTPPLGGLRVEGTLSFADQPVSLISDWILVTGHHARFEVGTEAAPYRHRAVITLTGHDPTENVSGEGHHATGTKFLAATHGATISIHGHRRDAVSWTVLDAHARPGDRTITLAEAVDWRPGDAIVIAPSGYSPFEAEQRTIQSVSGRQVTLTEPLDHRHFGEVQTIEGRRIDHRAEVGLLTRDVVIQGDASSTTRLDETGYRAGFGGHVMFMGEGTARVEGVEFVNMGQTGLKGRYPVHWHHAGDRPGDYARGNSVHHSFQRAFAVHHTQRATVEDNVAYHVLDHVYVFAEHGDEVDNVFRDNLAVLNWAKKPRDFAFPHPSNTELSNQGEERAGLFWGRNPHNVLTGNRAAGSYRGHGFFYDQQYMQGFTPLRQYLHQDKPITFTGNVAHSIYEIPGLGSHASYGPKMHGAGLMIGFREGPYPLVWGPDFLAYKVSHSGVWVEEPNETVVGATVTDSGIGVSQTLGAVRDLFVVGNTANDIGGPIPATARHLRAAGGVNITDQTQKKADENLRRVRIEGATFVDVEPAAITVEWDELELGSEVSGLEFVRTEPLFFFNKVARGSIYDADGSLASTGQPGAVYGEGERSASVDRCDWVGGWSGWFCPDDGRLAEPAASVTLAAGAEGGPEAGVTYRYWSGTFFELPGIDTLGVADGAGTAARFDLGALPVLSGHAVRFEGFLHVPTTGVYRFVLDAKEGGALRVGGETVIWGSRPGQPQTHEGWVRLQAGYHAIVVDHYKKLSNPQLTVRWEGPGFGLREIRQGDLARGTATGGGPGDGPGDGPGEEPAPPENQAPVVVLTSPSNGAALPAGQPATISAAASDADGAIVRVEFLVDGQEIAEVTRPPYAVTVRRAPLGTFTLTARATDDQGATTTSAPVRVTVGSGVQVASTMGASAWATDPHVALPTDLAVEGFYPNPFNPATVTRLALPEGGDYEVNVYDLMGRLVQAHALPRMAAGVASLRIDLTDHASGVYLMQVRHLTSGRSVSAQMTLVK